MDRHSAASKYLSKELSGIEIGACGTPWPNPHGATVKYVDNKSGEKLRLLYKNEKIPDPDIIDNGEFLSSMGDAGLDFVVSSHQLEHCQSPLTAMQNHLRVVRPGGFVLYAVPDKNAIFDKDRDLTTVFHLLADYDMVNMGYDTDDLRHYLEWVYFVDGIKDFKKCVEVAHEKFTRREDIHFHCWDEETLRSTLQISKLRLRQKFDLEDFSKNGCEFIF